MSFAEIGNFQFFKYFPLFIFPVVVRTSSPNSERDSVNLNLSFEPDVKIRNVLIFVYNNELFIIIFKVILIAFKKENNLLNTLYIYNQNTDI